jgi:Flp pilus assembly protein TadG
MMPDQQFDRRLWSNKTMKHRTYHGGQSLVEFALLATLLISLLLGIVDFGRAYYTQVQIKNAVGEAGYYAIQHAGDDAGIESAIRQELSHLDQAALDIPSPTRICTAGAGQTRIQVSYEHNLLFSFIIPSASVTLSNETVVPQIGNCS